MGVKFRARLGGAGVLQAAFGLAAAMFGGIGIGQRPPLGAGGLFAGGAKVDDLGHALSLAKTPVQGNPDIGGNY